MELKAQGRLGGVVGDTREIDLVRRGKSSRISIDSLCQRPCPGVEFGRVEKELEIRGFDPNSTEIGAKQSIVGDGPDRAAHAESRHGGRNPRSAFDDGADLCVADANPTQQ